MNEQTNYEINNECPCCFLNEIVGSSKNPEAEDLEDLCDYCIKDCNMMLPRSKQKRLDRMLDVMFTADVCRLPTTLKLMYEVLLEKIAETKD